jgi:hypothetical protein
LYRYASVSTTVVEKSNYPKPVAQVLGGSEHTARRSEAVKLEVGAVQVEFSLPIA